MALYSRFGASAGLLAALSMVSTPGLAAELPQGLVQSGQGSAVFADFDTTRFDITTFDSDTDIAEWRGRGWRRGGWRGGWRGHRRVDAGDVIAGVLILGGIAAVASAANNNRRRDREVVVVERDRRDYDRRDYDWREDRRRFDPRDRRGDNGTRGLDNAVDQCVDEIQRDVRVDSVNSVDRTARGWVVTGSLFNGSGFTCAIDNNGRIDAIEYGDFRGAAYDPARAGGQADGQYDDTTYLAARRTMDDALSGNRTRTFEATGRADAPLVEVDADLRPAYPGGPLPGEQFPE